MVSRIFLIIPSVPQSLNLKGSQGKELGSIFTYSIYFTSFTESLPKSE